MTVGAVIRTIWQSMLTCDTSNTAELLKQTSKLVAVGCQIVRITAPTVMDAANLQPIVHELRARGCLTHDRRGHPLQAGSGFGGGQVG